MLAFRTLDKRRLLSLTSLPPGETRVREQAAEIPFLRSLLAKLLSFGARKAQNKVSAISLPSTREWPLGFMEKRGSRWSWFAAAIALDVMPGVPS